MNSKRPFLFFALLLLLFLNGCTQPKEVSGAFPQEIYVWQRVWNESVERALSQALESAAGFAVLAAEIDLRGSEPKIFRPNTAYAALKSAGVPVALAIRVDPFGGPFRKHDRAIGTIVRLAREVVATSHEHGLNLTELQIDFDCGEWKLDGYREWLKQIRAAVAPLPVTPTILPSWLKHRTFARLARECGGFILQVRSVSLPEKLEETRGLTNPTQAAAWVEQAAHVGVPFRVSLPTYSYLVAFDASGKACGISAEGPMAHWAREARLVRWEAQPNELAELIARWTRTRPAMMRGVCWYRLPVASDNLNWSWKTLAVVMQGRAPKHALRVIGSASQPSEIVALNEGEADEPLPKIISADWSGAKLIAADALQGYALKESAGKDRVVFERASAGEILRLPPNGRRKLGWVRCEPSTKLAVSFSSDSSPAPAVGATFARDRP